MLLSTYCAPATVSGTRSSSGLPALRCEHAVTGESGACVSEGSKGGQVAGYGRSDGVAQRGGSLPAAFASPAPLADSRAPGAGFLPVPLAPGGGRRAGR